MNSQLRIGAPVTLNSIRDEYERGIPLAALTRKYKLSRSEAEDIAPEEFEGYLLPEGSAGY
jgi:hypothetical protein